MSLESIDGAEKAVKLKELLGLDATKPLMDQLGDQSKILLCLETTAEWELVIPHSMLDQARFDAEQCVEFYKPNQFGCLAMARANEQQQWKRLDDNDVAQMNNEIPNWLKKLVE